jgi:hypothetical protein
MLLGYPRVRVVKQRAGEAGPIAPVGCRSGRCRRTEQVGDTSTPNVWRVTLDQDPEVVPSSVMMNSRRPTFDHLVGAGEWRIACSRFQRCSEPCNGGLWTVDLSLDRR